MQINAPIQPGFETILTLPALELVVRLHRTFQARRQQLLAARVERARRLDAGERPDFLSETKAIRDGDWKVAPIPQALQCRRVEITGPVDAKMVINAFNSGADSYMTDFEDSNSPSWSNQIQGQINLGHAIRRTLTLEQGGKTYRLNERIATLQVRPRGWHLDEKHVLVDGQRVSGGIFDFALFMFHNAKEQIARGAGPVLLPAEDGEPPRGAAVERHLRDDAERARPAAGHDQGDGADRDHPRGVRDGRDPVRAARAQRRPERRALGLHLQLHQEVQGRRNFCLADRAKVTMTAPFMRAYALLLLKTCHKRGAPAIGGMSALIPIKNDPEKNAVAMAGIVADKKRDATDGYDGGWVAHPGWSSRR
jgi:malate synthase